MDLWLVFPVLAFSLFGAAVWASSLCQLEPDESRKWIEFSEARAWWRLMQPLAAGALVVAFLAGWALREPDPADERVAFEPCLLAGLVGAIVLRALFRATHSVLLARSLQAPIATVGLFRCRVVVSDAFKKAADEKVLDAALAHEAAHIRRRDPLRIWLAQLAADLQWPIPHGHRRFRNWALALEMQRDDEAVLDGASATALAESIIVAARLRTYPGAQPIARITGQGDGLALRVRRLLTDETASPPSGTRWHWWVRTSCLAAIVGAAMLGAAYGDSLLLLLPGVGR